MKNNRLRRSRTRSSARAGVTLVEMLVAMTVSLIMIYGLLQAFTQMLAYVNEGRAQVEISQQLRGVSFRLQTDLRNPTTPVRAWPTRVSGLGYTEYVEGLGHDAEPMLDFNTTLNGNFTAPSLFGDFDDVLMMTAASRGQPFVGQVEVYPGPVANTLDSPYAEVAWWCVWNNADGDLEPDVDEITLYRRVLLVRPDIAPYNPQIPGLIREWANIPMGSLPALWDELKDFYDRNDISVHPEVILSPAMNPTNITIRMWANSMSDLTRRENRFCHRPILLRDVDNSTVPPTYNNYRVRVDDANLHTIYPFEIVRYTAPNLQALPALTTVIQGNDELGEDVMQSHVLSFDIKAYDPYVPLLPSQNGTELLSPHDPGYGSATTAPPPVVGAGAFVDLFYMNYVFNRLAGPPAWPLPPNNLTVYRYRGQNTSAAYSVFSGPPAFYDFNGDYFKDNNEPYRGVTAPTYDTWSYHYEQDAVNQDWLALINAYGGSGNIPGALSWRQLPDQGSNGLDDDNANGVDDPNERETSPPYGAALRGLRISVRVNEPDYRQVRQMSVEQDFTPE